MLDQRTDRELARLGPLFDAHRNHLPDHLAWVTELDDNDRRAMIQEIATALVRAMVIGDWTDYDQALGDWRATAEVLSQPDLAARLLSEGDTSEEVALPRP